MRGLRRAAEKISFKNLTIPAGFTMYGRLGCALQPRLGPTAAMARNKKALFALLVRLAAGPQQDRCLSEATASPEPLLFVFIGQA